MFTVYVIKSKEGHHYTGYTSDMDKRLDQHNSGRYGWTKRGTNWRLIYSEKHNDKSEALKRELWLKSGHGREFLKSKLDGS